MERLSRLRTVALLGLSALIIATVHTAAVGLPAQTSLAQSVVCSDGIDNDHDGWTDYPNDGGCEGALDEDEVQGVYADRDPANFPEPSNIPPVYVTVADGRDFAEPGEILHYDIVVDNAEGPDRTFDLRSQIPAELSIEAVTENPFIDVRSLTWPNQFVKAGESRTYGVAARIASGTPDLQALRVRAYVGQAIGTDTTSIYRGVVPAAFSVSVSDGAAYAMPGDILEYEIAIHNAETKLATEVDVDAALPHYTEFVAASEGGAWTGNGIRWDNLTVSPKGDRLLGLRLRVRSDAPLGTAIQFVANVKGHQGVDITEVATASDVAPPQMENATVLLRKSADRTEVRPGETMTYTVYLRNTTDHTITNLTVEDRLDQRYMRVAGADAGAMQGDRIVWTIPSLAAGEDWQVRYTVSVAEGTPHGEALLNVVSVSGEGMEEISLTQRVTTASISVVSALPPAGAPLDLLFLLGSGIAALAPTLSLRKRVS
ncbi:MAG: hypothetical protein Greene041662_187 [Candidatus Peregrinibacteria bacterium Greene0416_62]|nr:MAG: hypothetical protein Greene041662_187 [Candidatus Peregrinibacteria bacterium Greene0416_62]TSC99588.1 MAG: hypothetical protein Greene101449_585 [Candidatus Peregrinibacteria bacterium Greene1014_49]